MRSKIKKSKPTTELTHVQISKDSKMVTITVFHMFKMLSRDMEDIL